MSNRNERKKKDGQDKGKKTKSMRESVRGRKRRAGPPRRSVDEVDTVKFKPGSASDERTGPQVRGAAGR
jgi:hypothetical protein